MGYIVLYCSPNEAVYVLSGVCKIYYLLYHEYAIYSTSEL